MSARPGGYGGAGGRAGGRSGGDGDDILCDENGGALTDEAGVTLTVPGGYIAAGLTDRAGGAASGTDSGGGSASGADYPPE